MKIARVGWALSLAAASGALFLGFWLADRQSLALVILALALAWEVCRRLMLRWLAALLMLAYCAAVIGGLWLFSWSGWSWIALPFSVATWDLLLFLRRGNLATLVVNENQLVRRHMLRLSVVLAVGALFSLITVAAQVRLSFGLAIFLGVLVVLGLGRGINLFTRSE